MSKKGKWRYQNGQVKDVVIRQEFGVEFVLRAIGDHKLRWFGCVSRMDDNRKGKRVWEVRTITRRGRETPRKTWNLEQLSENEH